MTGSILTDLAIGVLFSLLVYSLIASALCEALAGWLNWRGRLLRAGIEGLLQAPLAERVFQHGLLRGLQGPGGGSDSITGERRFPSNIPAATFARAVIETLVRELADLKARPASAKTPLAAMKTTIDGLAVDDGLKRRLTAHVTDPTETADALERDLATHFSNAMDRVTGWYVRRTKFALFLLGTAMAGMTNFNLFVYARALSDNEALRARVVAQAELAAEMDLPNDGSAASAVALNALDGSAMPFGWDCSGASGLGACVVDQVSLAALLSWIVIGLGCTLGGQFWFDLLKNTLKVRAAAAGVRTDAERTAA